MNVSLLGLVTEMMICQLPISGSPHVACYPLGRSSAASLFQAFLLYSDPLAVDRSGGIVKSKIVDAIRSVFEFVKMAHGYARIIGFIHKLIWKLSLSESGSVADISTHL